MPDKPTTENPHPAPWRWRGGDLEDAAGHVLLADGVPVDGGDYVPTVTAAAPEMEALLREHQWVFLPYENVKQCPECIADESIGHDADCRIGLLLARLDAAKVAG